MTVRFSTLLALVLAVAAPVWAQDADDPPADVAPPVSLSFVEGDVQYLNAGAAERATAPSMLNDGDGIRVRRGRAELVFDDGSVLHLADDTSVDLLGDRRLRLLDGRLVFRASAAAADGYTVDTPGALVHLGARGEYNLTVDGQQAVTVAVARGVAEIDDRSSRTAVRAGEEARLDRPGDRVALRSFNSARLDAFERWSLTRYEGNDLSASSRSLPSELRAYGQTFDRYGRWDTVAPYGLVWYPSVGVDWRPYYNGGWRRTRYGLTWYGADPWAWPTHHYGRWQSNHNSWFWVPARYWGPGWVSWAYASDYVSWAPLGWNSRPVVPFYYRAGYANPDRWRAWTVMPRGYLGRPGPVRPWVVDGRRATSTFVERPIPDYAVRRAARENRAVPRSNPYGSYSPTTTAPVTGVGMSPNDAGRQDRAIERGPSRTFEQQWGGMTPPSRRPSTQAEPRRQDEPQRQAEPQRQDAEPRDGAVRRGDSPAYAPRSATPPPPPSDRAEPSSRGEDRRTRSGPARAPRQERAEPSSTSPRTESARPRSEGGSSAGRSGGSSNGGRSNDGGGSGGTTRGSSRRPPGGR